jgi:hypothetical protein
LNINLDLFLITKKKIEKWMWKFTDITDETHPTCKLVISLNNSKRKKMTKKELKDSRYSLNNKWKCSFLTLNKIRQQITCFKDELARITRWEIVKIIVKVHFTIFFFTLYYFFCRENKTWKRSRWSWYFISNIFQPFANARLAKFPPVTLTFLRSFNFAYLLPSPFHFIFLSFILKDFWESHHLIFFG